MSELQRRPAHNTMELHEAGLLTDLGEPPATTACVNCRPRRRLRAADGLRMSRVKLIRWLRSHGLGLVPSRALADNNGTREPGDYHNDGAE